MNWIKVLGLNIIIFFGLLIVLELIFRMVVDFDSNYYAAPQVVEANSIREHPYGKIPVNSLGFFDGEWDYPKKLPRIGYFGDSVTYGVGAGYPYRITEYLDEFMPELEHVNLSGGLGVDLTSIVQSDELPESYSDYNLDKLIYLMNLNDIAPLAYYQVQSENSEVQVIDRSSSENLVIFIKKLMNPIDKILRGNSVFYTYARFQVKKFLTSEMGFEASGLKAIELTPEENAEMIKKAAMNTAKLSNLAIKKIPFCILLLPYEMQISSNAASQYEKLGIKFNDSFINFKTQKMFKDYFSEFSSVEIHWLGSNIIEADIGTYFVYNLGDKIDFNHPNRRGHEALARQISDERLCF